MKAKDSFKKKNFKYGGYATLVTAIVVAVVIALNLLVGALGWKVDLTKDGAFSLSEQTTTILNNLKSDIKITGLVKSGSQDSVYETEVLDRYAKASSKIKVEYIDPILHPEVGVKYSKDGHQLDSGYIVVESGSKYKVIDPSSLYTQTGSAVEKFVTSAISYVTADVNPKLFVTQSHSEKELTADVTSSLQNENYEIVKLDLLTGEWKYNKGDVLLINAPARDFSNEEIEKIKQYMKSGGRALIFRDKVKEDAVNATPNFNALLQTYGVSFENNYIIDADQTKAVYGYPAWLVPSKASHTILSPIIAAKSAVVVPYATAIKTVDLKRETVTVEPLLTTSQSSYGKKKADSQTAEKEAGDIDGPFNVAVAITDKVNGEKEADNPKLVVVASTVVQEAQINQLSKGGNYDFILNSIGWLSEKTDSITVREKDVYNQYLNIDAKQALTVQIVVIYVIPAIAAIAGIVVWRRRAHL